MRIIPLYDVGCVPTFSLDPLCVSIKNLTYFFYHPLQ